MLAKGQERAGVTVGRLGMDKPYPYQAVRWDDDGTQDHVAPHVLFQARVLELVLATMEPWVFMSPETVWDGVMASQEVEVSVETVGRVLRALARQNKIRHIGGTTNPRYAPKIRV
jgi:hypothetical protein